jgi:hypothetical protein
MKPKLKALKRPSNGKMFKASGKIPRQKCAKDYLKVMIKI